MIQNYTYKFRIYPNNTQKELMEKTFGCTRFIYNYYLNKKSTLYKESKGKLSWVDCSNHCNRELKKEFTWLVVQEELVGDIIGLMTSFSARLYGKRGSRNENNKK